MHRVLWLLTLALLMGCPPTVQGPPGPAGGVGPAGPAGPGFQRTVLVSPGEDPVTSGTALIAAVTSVDAGSGTLLIKIEPGVYDVGNNLLFMRDGIDIEGSGEGVTLIRGQSNSVIRAANAELRGLSVLNTGSGTFANGVDTFAATTNFRMTHVTSTVASDGGASFAEAFGGNGVLRDCTLSASGAANSYGVYANASGNVTIVNSVIQGTTNGGVLASGTGAVVNSQVVDGGIGFTCVNCYGATFVPLSNTCN